MHLFATCPPGGCRGAMSQQQQQCCQQLRANLCTLFRAEYPEPNKLGGGPLLLRFRSGARQLVRDYVVAFATRTQPPDCVLLRLDTAEAHPAGEAAEATQVLSLPAVVDRGEAPGRQTSFRSDEDVSAWLSSESPQWSISVLRGGRGPGSKDLARFAVHAEEAYSQASLDERRRLLLLQQAALKAARTSTAAKKRPERKRARSPRKRKSGSKTTQGCLSLGTGTAGRQQRHGVRATGGSGHRRGVRSRLPRQLVRRGPGTSGSFVRGTGRQRKPTGRRSAGHGGKKLAPTRLPVGALCHQPHRAQPGRLRDRVWGCVRHARERRGTARPHLLQEGWGAWSRRGRKLRRGACAKAETLAVGRHLAAARVALARAAHRACEARVEGSSQRSLGARAGRLDGELHGAGRG